MTRRRSCLRGAWGAAGPGIALALGAFGLLNLVGELLRPGFDATIWWIDLRLLPPAGQNLLLWAGAAALAAYGLAPRMSDLRRRATTLIVGLLLAAAACNAAAYYVLLARAALHAGSLLPLSLFVAAALAVVLRSVRRGAAPSSRRARCAAFVVLAAAMGAAFPFAQMICFGGTDYRRPADAVVVFGARVYADGTMSMALADRMRTAVDLYRQGYVRRIVCSGGRGSGAVHEAQAMRRMALGCGVPDEDILVDPAGLNTRATVANTAAMFARCGIRRALAVSHFYHLPRIKLSYQRRGVEVFTVPARETRPLTWLPYYMAREAAAQWVYYLRPLLACPPAGPQSRPDGVRARRDA